MGVGRRVAAKFDSWAGNTPSVDGDCIGSGSPVPHRALGAMTSSGHFTHRRRLSHFWWSNGLDGSGHLSTADGHKPLLGCGRDAVGHWDDHRQAQLLEPAGQRIKTGQKRLNQCAV